MKYFFYLTLFTSSTPLFFLFSTSTPSSEAECKGRKTFPFCKKKIKLFFSLVVAAFQASPLPPKRSAKVAKYIPHAIQTVFFAEGMHINNWGTERKISYLE